MWQPIETAPRNEYILVWPSSSNGTASCAKWDTDSFSKRPRPYWRRLDAGLQESRLNPPTHWMPIPDPPE